MRMIIAALALVSTPSTYGAIDNKEPVTAAVDGNVTTFLDLLKGGKGADAVIGIMSSPLWAQKAGSREAMTGQIDAAVRAYGPVVSYEKVGTDRLGTLVVREYFLVQHRDMVVRWEFELVRSAAGWQVGNFGFTDTPNTWF